MKKFYFILMLLATCLLFACSKDDGQEDHPDMEEVVPGTNHRMLVVYFSVPETDGVDASSGASRVIVNGNLYGNIQYVATVIREATGADMIRINTVQTYPGSHTPLINFAQEELNANARPELTTTIGNFEDYDVVFVGYPIWWSEMPMALYSFFDQYDFSGKSIVPFTVHGGSGWAGTIGRIAGLYPNATMVQGYSVSRNSVGNAREGILSWLKEIQVAE